MKQKFLILFSLLSLWGISGSIQIKAKSTDSSVNNPTIGTFSLNGNIVRLYSNGKVEYDGMDLGVYTSLGGEAYKVRIENDAWFVYLIEGTDVYEVGAGSAGVISDFDFNPSSNCITITEIDGGEVTDEDLESLDLNSPELPLSDLFIVSEIHWDNASLGNLDDSGSADTDKSFLGIMKFCNPSNGYDGPSGKTAKEIIKSIESVGYILEDSYQNYFSIIDPIDEEFYDVDAMYALYTQGDNSILCVFQTDENGANMDETPFRVTIVETESEMRKFVKDAISKGFVKEGDDMGELYVAEPQPAGGSFNVMFGNDATIQINFSDSH